jgi:HlyD family secretion protein
MGRGRRGIDGRRDSVPTDYSVKILLIVIVIVVVLGGALMGGGWYMRSRVAGDEITPVRIERAAVGDLVEIVSAPGQIQPRNKISISARVAARIISLPYLEGQQVTGGREGDPKVPASVLVELDAKEYMASLKSAEARKDGEGAQLEVSRARVASLEATVEGQEISLADARRDLKRQLALRESGDVSQATLEQAQTKCDNLEAQIRSAKQNLESEKASIKVLSHNLDAAEADIQRQRDALTYCKIESPIDGTVTRVNAKVGELVVMGTMNNAGTVILEVANLNIMLAVAKLDETTIAGVEKGQKAIVHIQAYPDEEFSGVVDTVALSSTDEARDGTKYYKTEILLDTKGRRIPCGLSCDVDIQVKNHSGVVKTASQAVLGRAVDELPSDIRKKPEVDQNKTTATVVYRCVDGKAVITPVKIGPSDVTNTIITSGLSATDQVITGPYKVLETLKDGQKVKEMESGSVAKPSTK